MGISFSNIGTVGREQLITSGSNGEPNWSYIPSKGKSTKKVNNRTYQFADEKTKKQIAYMSGYYLQTVPQSVKAAWQETLEETGFNPFQTDVTSILTQLSVEQDFLTGGDDNIFGETKESCLAAIDKVLERIENPLAAVTEERAAYLQQESAGLPPRRGPCATPPLPASSAPSPRDVRINPVTAAEIRRRGRRLDCGSSSRAAAARPRASCLRDRGRGPRACCAMERFWNPECS